MLFACATNLLIKIKIKNIFSHQGDQRVRKTMGGNMYMMYDFTFEKEYSQVFCISKYIQGTSVYVYEYEYFIFD